jgi:hypothetical protein
MNLKHHLIEYYHFLLVEMVMMFHLDLNNQMLDDNLEHKLIDVVREGNL